MRRVVVVLVGLILTTVTVLYLLGRGRIGEPETMVRLPQAGEVSLRSLRLYFGNPEGSGLVAENRVIAEEGTLTGRLRACVRELAAGSQRGGVAVIPESVRLHAAFVDPWGLAYLDFDRRILGSRPPGDNEEWLAVAAIVHTICENVPEVREIRFMVAGQVVTSLHGYLDLEEPLTIDDFPLGPLEPGGL